MRMSKKKYEYKFPKQFVREQRSATAQIIEHILTVERAVTQILDHTVADMVSELNQLVFDMNTALLDEILEQIIERSANNTESLLTKLMKVSFDVAIDAGSAASKKITGKLLQRAGMSEEPLQATYFRVNKRAVEQMNRRTINGLNLSDRIWTSSRKINRSLGEIVRDGMHNGEHPVQIAKKLDVYVQKDARTLKHQYPNMAERIGHMIPNDLSYEAVRLARTETMAAFGQATIESAQVIPSLDGLQWALSNAGVACKHCVENAERDTGYGPGVYKVNDVPKYPAHPNCMCILLPVLADSESFTKRLLDWQADPSSDPELETWFREHYLNEPYSQY